MPADLEVNDRLFVRHCETGRRLEREPPRAGRAVRSAVEPVVATAPRVVARPADREHPGKRSQGAARAPRRTFQGGGYLSAFTEGLLPESKKNLGRAGIALEVEVRHRPG